MFHVSSSLVCLLISPVIHVIQVGDVKKVSSMLDASIYTLLGSVTGKVLSCVSVRLFKFSLL